MRLMDKVQVYLKLWVEKDERKSHRIRNKNQSWSRRVHIASLTSIIFSGLLISLALVDIWKPEFQFFHQNL